MYVRVGRFQTDRRSAIIGGYDKQSKRHTRTNT